MNFASESANGEAGCEKIRVIMSPLHHCRGMLSRMRPCCSQSESSEFDIVSLSTTTSLTYAVLWIAEGLLSM